jgi:glucosamine-6-phosphate deaminase
VSDIDPKQLLEWCRIPGDELASRKDLKVPLRRVDNSAEMGELMARELVDLIEANNAADRPTRAIIPCGPHCWYEPWGRVVNERRVSLRTLTVFHMDECMDWQGRLLPEGHPYNFRSSMEKEFYGPVPKDLNVPGGQRYWLTPASADSVAKAIAAGPIDVTYGGWGQDGHIAYNQARRHPYSRVTIEQVAQSTIRIQENNWDTVIALAQRSFGGAYQFVPPMSITLGVKECLSARKVRVFSDTGAWKQTALRVALFADPTPDYPMTLLQRHGDALITATRETARHPISENPDWRLF